MHWDDAPPIYKKEEWVLADTVDGKTVYFVSPEAPEKMLVIAENLHKRLRGGKDGPLDQYVLEALFDLDQDLTKNRMLYEVHKDKLLPLWKSPKELREWGKVWSDRFCPKLSYMPHLKLELLREGYSVFYGYVVNVTTAELLLLWEQEEGRYDRGWYKTHPRRTVGTLLHEREHPRPKRKAPTRPARRRHPNIG